MRYLTSVTGVGVGAGAGLSGSLSFLNPFDKTAAITLSNSNLTANNTSGTWEAVRGTVSHSTGKHMFRVVVNTSGETHIGVGQSGVNLGAATTSALAWCFYSDPGSSYKANNGSYTAYGSTVTTSDTVDVLVDFAAGAIEFRKNGTPMGVAFSGQSLGALFPLVAVRNGNSKTFNPGEDGTLNAGMPAGYSGWF